MSDEGGKVLHLVQPAQLNDDEYKRRMINMLKDTLALMERGELDLREMIIVARHPTGDSMLRMVLQDPMGMIGVLESAKMTIFSRIPQQVKR